jgi:hypothetical protein
MNDTPSPIPAEVREQFHAWCAKVGVDSTYWMPDRPDAGYKNVRVHDYWVGWLECSRVLACASSPSMQPAGYVTAIEEGKVLMLPRHSLNTDGLIPLYKHPAAPSMQAEAAPVLWQWRKKGAPWTLEYTFHSEVFATTPDSEVRALYACPSPASLPTEPGEVFWLYELNKGEGIYQAMRGPDAERIVKQIASEFPESGEPFALSAAAPSAASRVAGVEPLPGIKALTQLFRENEIPMSDRNSFLWTCIEDALDPGPPSATSAGTGQLPEQQEK